MSVFQEILSKVKKQTIYGHNRRNIENISSLSIANKEITELLKKSVENEDKYKKSSNY